MRRTLWVAPILALAFGLGSGCTTQEKEPSTTFYDRKIGPILTQSCASSPTGSGCHVAADNKGNALGNLNVTSYETTSLRSDLFEEFGPYGMPNLLLKAVPPFTLRLTSYDGEVQLVTTDIAHQGGSLLDRNSASFTTLLRWIDRGATENNSISRNAVTPSGGCSTTVGSDPAFDSSAAPSGSDYKNFNATNSILGASCAASNCHGTTANTLYLTCGSNEAQKRWNYFSASDYVSKTGSGSELLRKGLSPTAGGVYHEGGDFWETTDDPDYKAVEKWVLEKGTPTNIPSEAGFELFAKRVQPMLAKRGCMVLGCHSPAMGHDYRLRGGSSGHFSLSTTRKNYELTLEQVALESEDPNASRLIRKNLPPYASEGGIIHRGGALLSRESGAPDCDLDAAKTGPLDEQDPYCVLVAWIQEERAERMATATPFRGIVYVKRAPGALPVVQDFEAYNPGSELIQTLATLDATGVTVGAPVSLNTDCGLDASTADIRRPAVSWDGTKIAFAARSSASEPLRIYEIDGGNCSVHAGIDAAPVDEDGKAVPDNGELIHNFDPAYAPNGALVFASTRGNIKNVGAFDYQGPQRSPANPSRLNANLYLFSGGKIRQMTFLLDQEVRPAFMSDGRIIMVSEKRAPGFYQLAGRRLNYDGGDYHPLFAQRGTIGFAEMTSVVELADKNLAMILTAQGAQGGAGTLAIANRSVGIDQLSDDKADYVQDAAAISYPNPDFYQRSVTIVDPDATGQMGGTNGAYRDPAALPDGTVLVSYAANVSDLSNVTGNFDIAVVNPVTRERNVIISDADNLLWPVGIYERPNRGLFESKPDEPNGNVQIFTDSKRRTKSDVLVMDFPVLSSLLFQNTRTGRVVNLNNPPVEVWESMPPKAGVTSYAEGGKFVADDEFGKVYVRRRRLGVVRPREDGSARFQFPGGVPIVLATDVQLEGDKSPKLHFQRESMQFYPGEWARQSFKRELFNGICGSCHGSISGLENEVVVNPDVLTQASSVDAKNQPVTELLKPGSEKGPPFD